MLVMLSVRELFELDGFIQVVIKFGTNVIACLFIIIPHKKSCF